MCQQCDLMVVGEFRHLDGGSRHYYSEAVNLLPVILGSLPNQWPQETVGTFGSQQELCMQARGSLVR